MDNEVRERPLAELGTTGTGLLTIGSWCPACGTVLQPARRAAQKSPIPAGLPQSIAAAMQLTSALSSRERCVFRLLGLGCDNRSIARKLHISERTVKRHVTAILAKLELESRLQAGLAALTISTGILAPPAAPSADDTSVNAVARDARLA